MGYVHDNLSLYIPPTLMLPITGTWTETAGAVAGTIAKHKAAAAETSNVYIPIPLPTRNNADKGSKINTIEVDYEITIAACTSVTATLNKVTRGVNTAVAVVAAVTITQDLAAAVAAATADQHLLTITITTPEYLDPDEYYILQMAFVCAAGSVLDVLGAVANYTARL
jgi:hypothetical protein